MQEKDAVPYNYGVPKAIRTHGTINFYSKKVFHPGQRNSLLYLTIFRSHIHLKSLPYTNSHIFYYLFSSLSYPASGHVRLTPCLRFHFFVSSWTLGIAFLSPPPILQVQPCTSRHAHAWAEHGVSISSHGSQRFYENSRTEGSMCLASSYPTPSVQLHATGGSWVAVTARVVPWFY
jgi:hypothetical protein